MLADYHAHSRWRLGLREHPRDRTARRRLAFQTGSVAVSIDDRLAPEHPYPAGLIDCRNLLDWLIHEGDKIGGDPTLHGKVTCQGSTCAILQYDPSHS
ncbi:alpha/beta hydrolase fold domain-containing protein [Rhizobium sp. RCC_161_2]|uniref:alpha/beta hydrolase fold domain-containing protein n=1 Tax=Rhizobium sp. RCC_161_2 TaxID=3239219 RepID=UPI00352438F7